MVVAATRRRQDLKASSHLKNFHLVEVLRSIYGIVPFGLTPRPHPLRGAKRQQQTNPCWYLGEMWTSVVATLLLSISPVASFVPYPTSAFGVVHPSLSMAPRPEIVVVSQPDQDFLAKRGVFDWGTWGCGVSKFPWSYSDAESCYLLAGAVTVTPTDGRSPATFKKGDFVTFPAGMTCTWDVTEAVEKHFMFS